MAEIFAFCAPLWNARVIFPSGALAVNSFTRAAFGPTSPATSRPCSTVVPLMSTSKVRWPGDVKKISAKCSITANSPGSTSKL